METDKIVGYRCCKSTFSFFFTTCKSCPTTWQLVVKKEVALQASCNPKGNLYSLARQLICQEINQNWLRNYQHIQKDQRRLNVSKSLLYLIFASKQNKSISKANSLVKSLPLLISEFPGIKFGVTSTILCPRYCHFGITSSENKWLKTYLTQFM